MAKNAAMKSAELAAETAQLAKEGKLIDVIKEKAKQVRTIQNPIPALGDDSHAAGAKAERRACEGDALLGACEAADPCARTHMYLFSKGA